jgi:hypothetical protein
LANGDPLSAPLEIVLPFSYDEDRPRRVPSWARWSGHQHELKDGFMAGKPLNRLELRRQSDAAEPLDPMEDESEELVDDADDDESAGERKTKKKPKAAVKKAKAPKAAKAAKPTARMKIVWTVMNDAFKAVGSFEYSQKAAADARAAELTAKGKGTHFVMKSKEPMSDNAPGLGAAIPRVEIAPPAAVVVEKAAAAVDDEEEVETEGDDEEDEEAEAEEETEDE